MSVNVYYIAGGDYSKGGQACRCVKEQLKKIGAEPAVIRRAMIAAYEAEMNVVIHASQGRMEVLLDNNRLDVDVIDEGPGIADIELALKEGYSTAPPVARELGFGAGMGLPNIKKNVDRFTITSEVGKGTHVSFSIDLKAAADAARGENSILATPEKCRGCMYCLRMCPTKALRIHEGKPVILDYLCIDCTSCIGTCDSDAITITGSADKLSADKAGVIVLPSAAMAQFGSEISCGQIVELLNKIGFSEIVFLQRWEDALREAVSDYAAHEAQRRPVISPACPAVLNLIRMRFPSLIGNIAPFYPAIWAAGSAVGDREAVYVAICPAQRTLLASGGLLGKSRIILPSALRSALMPMIVGGEVEPQRQKGSAKADAENILQITGIRHVMNILEEIEDGQIDDAAVIELYACDHGCFGSPLLTENPFVAAYRWLNMGYAGGGAAKAVSRRGTLTARQGVRLDKDMARAIEKLGHIEQQIRTLPGRDCSICGAPSCAAMAEDIVLGRAKKSECVFFRD